MEQNQDKNSLVYDIGCGNGRNMNFKNLNFIGIDNCENFVKICNEKKLNVVTSNITEIPAVRNTPFTATAGADPKQMRN